MIPSGTVRKYDTYKDSGIAWIGAIPERWNIVKTGRLFRNTKEIVGENSVKVERLALTLNGVIKRDKNDAEGLQPEQFDGYQYLRKNQLVFKLIDLENVNTSRVGICPFEEGMVSPAYIILKNNAKNNKFYYYFFLSLWYNEIFNHLGGDGVRSALNAKDLLNIPTVDISANEQQTIADYLDEKCGAIDKTIETEEKVIEKLKEYKQSLITETVTKGLDKSAPMKDSGIPWIGQIPQHWEVKRLKRIATSFAKGKGITKEEVVEDGTVSCVRYGEIYSKYNNKFDSCFSKTKVEFLPTPQYFSYGDILFAGTGELIEEIGKNIVYVGKEQCLAGGDIIVLRHQENPIFLNYALGSSYSQAQKSYGKIKLKVVHISESSIGNILIALPTREEQNLIADYLEEKCSKIDKAISDKEQVIEKLTEYKKSLIYECVTGKRMVV